MFFRARQRWPGLARHASASLTRVEPLRRPKSSGPELVEHFDAVSEVYYRMVDGYRTDLGYYHGRELEAVERWAKALRPARLLDAGSGPGRHSRLARGLGLRT